ncbi:aa3-type cytochrome oxidase subunit III [Devriesea agamarum]|uniref:aa3-type cytochrome oxidase subunit III n=1 Tax=Devriesea agamarum TaxID=472569 RepID=UPI000A035B4A|nr:heme-copper oxidase subunit III [Devriesea agamarum]
MSTVTAATLAPSASPSHTVSRPNPTQIGTIIWLSSELMFFAGLFAMYFTLRAVVPDVWAEEVPKLAKGFASVNTAILVLSSVTCQFGVFAAERHQKRRTGSLLNLKSWGVIEWFTLTYIMGAIFVAGQAYEYAELIHKGITMSSSPYGSVFYLTTGFHALHVTGGLVVFLLVLGRIFAAKRFTNHEAVSAICLSYYWHFVDVVWIALYFIVYWLDTVTGAVPATF